MEYRVLCPLEVRDGAEPLPLAGAKQRALLALLLVHANHVLSRDRLIDELWGSEPPETAVQSLQVYVSRLRKLVPADTLLTRPPGYLLEIEPDELDLQRFERLLAEGRAALAQGDAGRASSLLHEALALWRGPALAEFVFEPFAQAEIRRLEELRLAAIEERIEADLALGRHPDLIGELEVLIADNSHRERLRGQLMLALYRCGRQPEALAVFTDARARLVEELGIEPGRELRELQHAILEQRDDLDFLPPPPRRVELPAQTTAIVGRGRELDELERLLSERRLVTLVGVGGSGKTRLAIEAAQRVAESFPDGVFWVGLQALDDPALVLATVAQALEVRARPGEETPEALRRVLHDRTLLLLVDNAEHVLDGTPALGELLEDAGGLKVLATSRERLGLRGEWEYSVEPLEAEAAVELFVARAAAVRSQLEIDTDVAAEICARVDRLPLSIELAAALVRMLHLAEILARLDHRLAALTEGPRDAPARQRTLRATIEWSYELLEPAERDAFAKLAVFSGGWSLEAAELAAGVTPDKLERLLARSLVRRVGGRFTMLETVREFARELFEQRDDAHSLAHAHATFFRDLGGRLWLDKSRATRELGARDADNARAAVLWALASAEYEIAIELIHHFDAFRLPPAEVLGWLNAALAVPELLDDAARARALKDAGEWCFQLGKYDEARPLLEQCLELARRLEDAPLESGILLTLGTLESALGQVDAARDHLAEALRIDENSGDVMQYVRSLLALGELEREHGVPARSRELHTRAVELALENSDPGHASYAFHGLGETALEEGELDEAAARYTEALGLAYGVGDTFCVLYCLAGLAAVAALEDDAERAGLLWGAVQSLEEDAGFLVMGFERRRYDAAIARLGGAAFDAHVAAGRELAVAAAVEYTLASIE